jgi:hypothetical protein
MPAASSFYTASCSILKSKMVRARKNSGLPREGFRPLLLYDGGARDRLHGKAQAAKRGREEPHL